MRGRRQAWQDPSVFGASIRVVAAHKYKEKPGLWYTVQFVTCDSPEAKEAEETAKRNRRTKEYQGLAFFGTLEMAEAPYMIYKGSFRVKDTKLMASPSNFRLRAQRPSHVRISDAIYMLVNEFKSYKNNRDAKKALVQMMLAKQLSWNKDKEVAVDDLERVFFSVASIKGGARLQTSEMVPRLRRIFAGDNSKRGRTLSQMKREQLADLHQVASKEPWMLCFYRNCGKKYEGMGELSYDGFVRALTEYRVHRPPDDIMCALRLYTKSIKEIRKRVGYTSFDLTWLRSEHLQSQWGKNDAELLDRALVFLLRAGVLVQVGETHVAREKDHLKAGIIVKALVDMSQLKSVPALRPGNAVPSVLAGDLDDGQKEAAQHILAGWPLTIVTGSPGTGKSETGIVWTVARFLRVLVVSFVGTMVMQHKERLGQAYTVHHVHHTVLYNEWGAMWAANFDVVVLDEASNVSLSLMHRLLKSVGARRSLGLRGMLQFVLVMDEHQQQPINPGCPAVDFKNAFPEHTFELKTQHRQGDGAYIPFSAQLLLENRLDEVEWAVINSRRLADFKAVLDDKDNALVRIDPSACPNTTQFVNNVMPSVLKDANDDISQWLFFSFRNKEVDEISHRVREWLLKKGKLDVTKQVCIRGSQSKYSAMSALPKNRDGLYLGPGTKIIFKDKFVGEWDYKNCKPKHPTVFNGEIAIVKRVKYDGSEVELEDGRVLLMDKKRHVDPTFVRYAYCVTAYASQGMTVDVSVTYVHSNPGEHWRRPPLYVAWTRPRKRTIIWGNYADIKAIAEREPWPRDTILSQLLKASPNYEMIRDAPGRQKRDPLPEFRSLSVLWKPQGVKEHGPTIQQVKSGLPFKWDFDGTGLVCEMTTEVTEAPTGMDDEEFDRVVDAWCRAVERQNSAREAQDALRQASDGKGKEEEEYDLSMLLPEAEAEEDQMAYMEELYGPDPDKEETVHTEELYGDYNQAAVTQEQENVTRKRSRSVMEGKNKEEEEEDDFDPSVSL